MTSLWRPIQDLFHLFFPNICLSCGDQLYRGETVLCLTCQHFLPKTYFHDDPQNPVYKLFWGRVPIQFATACYYFSKGSRVQQLLHHLKYNHRTEVGTKIGKLYGQTLKEHTFFNDIELIVPVPLHPRKERRRGYNQSAAFADGLSKAMGLPWTKKALTRTHHTPSQTYKKRYERWENVHHKFQLHSTHLSTKNHVLLVDDVITTGATLEACAHTLLQHPSLKVSIATIAYAAL